MGTVGRPLLGGLVALGTVELWHPPIIRQSQELGDKRCRVWDEMDSALQTDVPKYICPCNVFVISPGRIKRRRVSVSKQETQATTRTWPIE